MVPPVMNGGRTEVTRPMTWNIGLSIRNTELGVTAPSRLKLIAVWPRLASLSTTPLGRPEVPEV